jgi:hypothetical protein
LSDEVAAGAGAGVEAAGVLDVLVVGEDGLLSPDLGFGLP